MASFFLIIMVSTSLLLIPNSEGREFLVGGSEDSWNVPLPSPDFLNHWAGTQRFEIGDALIFKYNNMTESVQMVPKEDYESCYERVGDDHQSFNDGNTKVILRSSGPIYFISGKESHCHMGLKLVVVVMSSMHHHQQPTSPNHSLPLPPSPSPASNEGALASTPATEFMMGLGVSLVMLFYLAI
ncbi:hypothetical protein PIB30_044800 [Stylosanthes scabra]|uniref:Phytocyanin domain-containing protein n=1 Tax=Stylosanthes scabra TaxID=79078 RepID=A0ABU6TFN1_9FABA|nr:hypothetical protein [Stylosanthes scabra]